MPEKYDKYFFSKPANYRINILGELDASWSDKLAGMTITHECDGDGDKTTSLEGYLRDQAALSGILNALYELHFPVLSVKLVKD